MIVSAGSNKNKKMVKCSVCESEVSMLFNKDGYDYYECNRCKTVFTPGGINQEGMVGGEHEVGRNEKENHVRIERFIKLVGLYGRILDYGCGHGMLVKDCQKMGLNAEGYDKFNPEFSVMPDGKFNLCSMIEVIEHTSHPFQELDIINEKLLPNGILLVETSFTDVAKEENIPLVSFFYISPEHGHCTIFSHYGLDLIMKNKGYDVLPCINRNVRLFRKK